MPHYKQLSMNGVHIGLDNHMGDVCFVSHAHSDHTSAFYKGKPIIASEETFHLMGKEPQSHAIEGISLHPAGHMLGARQILSETQEGRLVYTGDFSLHESFTERPAQILQCDTLMIDSTYCLPHLRFPNRRQVSESIARYAKANSRAIVIFGAYNCGKAQELTRLLNVECGIAPVVGTAASKFCRAYERCGVKLDYISAGTDEAEEAMHSPFVAIMPPHMVNFEFGSKLSEAFGRDVKTAVATGWSQVSRFPVDESFPLSDHADFKDTMRYIYESCAKKVVCANSGAQAAAAYLRSIGLDAIAESEAPKMVQARLSNAP